MNTIINFLKDNLRWKLTEEPFNVSKQDTDKPNFLFAGQNKPKRHSRSKGIKPQVNQIWAVKEEYFDFLGIKQTTSHPILVSLLTDIDHFEEEDFVRVAVISPFIEMATQQDDICNDISIAGFPFLVENWNEQPILTEILDEYIGYYEPRTIFNKRGNISVIQKQFQEIEISRAKFLNNSISSLVGFAELNQHNEFGVVISVNEQVFLGGYPKAEDEYTNNEPTIEQPNTEDEDTVLSKSGVIKKSKTISFEDKQLPFEIQIKKMDEGFVISTITCEEITLSDSDNQKQTPISNSEKRVFTTLKKGLYTLYSKNIQEPIKIRLK